MEDDVLFEALTDLTQDGSFSDAMGRLYLISKVRVGLREAEEGMLTDQESVWGQMRTWIA